MFPLRFDFRGNVVQRYFVLTCVGWLLFFLPGSVRATSGDLDPTYGNGGKVTTNFFDSDIIRDVAVQLDGKIVVVGTVQNTSQQPIIARYKLNGSLDPAFGSNGKVFASASFFPQAVVIQPDGRIIAAGSVQGSFGLMRFNRDGSLDSTFGAAGVASIRFLPGASSDLIFDVALQPDGKIVAAGDVDSGQWFALARFNPDGSPEATFGDGGRVRPGMGPGFERANGVAIQNDLKIVAVGEAFNGATQTDFALARFKPNGELDETFGNGGRAFTNFNNLDDGATCVVLQPDGKILAGGNTHQPFGTNSDKLHFGLARYEANGNLDFSFEGDGKVITGFFGSAAIGGIVLQPDGRIVAAGSAFANPAGGRDFVLVRYNSDGAVDNSFGNLGTVITDFGGEDFADAVVLQPDNKIVVAGEYFNFSDGRGDFALARYFVAPTNSPVLQTEPSSNHAIAFDSVTFVRDPFAVTNDHNFSADHQSRILIIATNLTLSSGENFSAVSVQAEDGGGAIHTLPVEYVGEVPSFEWLTQVVVKLPTELTNAGTVQLSVSLHGNVSNNGSVLIQ
jgi:uncharacterized delta-60 repeat protein